MLTQSIDPCEGVDCTGDEQCIAGECRCGDSEQSESCTNKPWGPLCMTFPSPGPPFNTIWTCACWGAAYPVPCDQETEVCNLDLPDSSNRCIKGGQRIIVVLSEVFKNFKWNLL